MATTELMTTVLADPCDRRGFIARCAAAPVVVAGATGLSAVAAAGNVHTYKGRYAIDSHRIVDGFFARPRGTANFDVVLVISQSGTLDDAAEQLARGYAADGYMAIAPNLPTSYRGASLGGKQAMVAALMRDMPRLKGMPRGSGKIAVIAA